MENLEEKIKKSRLRLIVAACTILVCVVLVLLVWQTVFVAVPLAGGAGYLIYCEYYRLRSMKSRFAVLSCVQRGMREIDEMASSLGWQPSVVRKTVEACFAEGYLADFCRVGEKILSRAEYEANVRSRGAISVRCPRCGAMAEGKEGETVACPYCGNRMPVKSD